MSVRIDRRQFFRMAAVSAGGTAAFLVMQHTSASNDPTEGTLSAETFQSVAADQFQVTASLSKRGWTTLPAPVRLTFKKAESKPLINTSRYKSSRLPIDVTFSGPTTPLLTSATYRLGHASWKTTVNVFLVRVDRSMQNPTYEAIFN